jgi:hypothetical protein
MSKSKRVVTVLVLVILAALGAIVMWRLKARGIESRWLLLEEPVGQALAIGHMWDGTTPTSDCYAADIVIDTLGGEDRELRIAAGKGDIAMRLMGAIGLEQLGRRTGRWSMTAWGSRIATARNPRPILRESCSPQRDGLPQYPMVTGLLGYDSVLLVTTTSGNVQASVTPDDTTVLRRAGISLVASDSSLMLRRGRGLWFGFRALGLTRVADSACTKEAGIGEEVRCGASPYGVTVSQRLPAQYRVESVNRDAPNARTRTDTVSLGGYITLGVTQESEGSFGDWYSVQVSPSTTPQRVTMTIRRLRYQVERFEREAHRGRWKKFIER